MSDVVVSATMVVSEMQTDRASHPIFNLRKLKNVEELVFSLDVGKRVTNMIGEKSTCFPKNG